MTSICTKLEPKDLTINIYKNIDLFFLLTYYKIAINSVNSKKFINLKTTNKFKTISLKI